MRGSGQRCARDGGRCRRMSRNDHKDPRLRTAPPGHGGTLLTIGPDGPPLVCTSSSRRSPRLAASRTLLWAAVLAATPAFSGALSGCPGWGSDLDAGDHVVGGAQPGSPEVFDRGDCPDGMYWAEAAFPTAPARCVSFSKLGEPCGQTSDCVAGTFCADFECVSPADLDEECGPHAHCTDGSVCVLPEWPPSGGRCRTPGSDGTPCSFDSDCDPHLSCLVGYGRCGAPRPLGAPCKHNVDCEGKLVCAPRALPPHGTVCSVRGWVGAPCIESSSCDYLLHCVKSSIAEPTDVGACVGLGGEGSTCVRGSCSEELWCVPSCALPGTSSSSPTAPCTSPDAGNGLGMCRGPSEEGGPCLDIAGCVDGLSCNEAVPWGGGLGTCLSPGREGDPCRRGWSDCLPPLLCAYDRLSGGEATCQPRTYWGPECNHDWDCEEGARCVAYFGRHAFCSSDLTAPCEDDADCADGLSCAFVDGGLDETCGSTWMAPTHAYQCADWEHDPDNHDCSVCTDWENIEVETWGSLVCGQCGPTGPSGEGAQCGRNADCSPGLVCHSMGMTCVSRGGPGTPCMSSGDCRDELACFGEPGRCQLRRSLGEPCEHTDECAERLICRKDFQGPDTCQRTLALPCKTSADCSPGMECAATLGGIDGTCTETIYDQTPDPCCNAGTWEAPAACSQCRPLPGALGDGEPCHASADCAGRLVCRDGWIRRCGPPARPGEPCKADGDCEPGLVCRGQEMTCVAPGGNGESCTMTAHCATGLVCHGNPSGVCMVPRALNAPCVYQEDCEDGLWCGGRGACTNGEGWSGACFGGSCPPGMRCDAHWQCRVRPCLP